MKNMIFAVCTAAFIVLAGGCVNPGPAPQDVPLKSRDGRAVIIKDITTLPLIENDRLEETEIVKIFFPKDDNIIMKCSMTLLKIPSGISPPKYKQTSAQIIYAISGGGKLLINGNMIVLKKGIMVYVPPNTPMTLTNNVNKVLEIIVVTSPPFETSQMTLIENKPQKVKVAKDAENTINDEEVPSQSLSEKYKAKKRSKRIQSVDEYRDRISKELLTEHPKEEDTISDLLKEDLSDTKVDVKPKLDPKTDAVSKTDPKVGSKADVTPKADPKTGAVKADPKATTKSQTENGGLKPWPLEMPDNSKVPLKKLEEEQREKLIPATPQKIENVKLGTVQDLTTKEEDAPIAGKTGSGKTKTDSSKSDQDSLEKLLKEQEEEKKKQTSPKVAKVKKTSLKHVQELSPAERAVKTKSDTDPNL